MADFEVRRLTPDEAPGITSCFERVYGRSYATPHFYDSAKLAELIASQQLCCVGAVDVMTGVIVGHMALTAYPHASSAELGNTVVAPEARGGGVAWQIGAALSGWARELGYTGFVHYPTTDHHIMQRQSVKQGFETGLMLGYIPAETDGKVSSGAKELRQAATIVYEPYGEAEAQTIYAPAEFLDLLQSLAAPTRLPRTWLEALTSTTARHSQVGTKQYPVRNLQRLTVTTTGTDVGELVKEFDRSNAACKQIDLVMNDAGLGYAAAVAMDAGYLFCGWLPGLAQADLLRLQKIDAALTDFQPQLVNLTAQALLNTITGQSGSASTA